MDDKQCPDAGLRELALFAGAGGGILGGKLLGWRTVCAVEWEPYPASVLAARQNDGFLPPFPIWDDVQTFDGKPWRGLVDVVSGGFPCQAFSSAARGRNTARDYWPEMLRVVGEVQPEYVFAENVSEDSICNAQADLAEAGYSTIRGRVSAGQLGADHVRNRWWLVAYANVRNELGRPIYAEVGVLQEGRSCFWKAEPYKSGMDDGVAARLDRLKAIGNGQCPLAAARAFTVLSDWLSRKTSNGRE